MPRPKVKPQDRQRSARACDTCKASKKRCDANQPCRLCLKKGTQDTCTYTPTRRDRRSRHSLSEVSQGQEQEQERSLALLIGTTAGDSAPSPAAHAHAQPHQQQQQQQPILDISSQQPRRTYRFGCQPASALQGPPLPRGVETHQPDVDEDDAESETDYVPDSRNSVERTTQQRPVLLYSSSGDKVFVGNTAALSFLRFLQHTLKHYAGPSGFTDRQHSHNWFEVIDSAPSDAAFYDDLDDDEKNDLIHCFVEVSSGFLDLYSQDELVELTRSAKDPQQPSDKTVLASFYLMLAIGCQVRGSSRDDLVRASKYFAQGRKLAFEKMLEDATVNLVRAFILLAFYMFGACRRNSAFMYLGVAAKSADILGLHAAAQNRRMSKVERDSRLRVAKSIRVFDIICSSILGRRGSAPSLRSVDVTSGDMDQEQNNISCHRALALRATYESCSILETVVGKFADDGALKPSSAEHFLQLLKEWSEVLPVSLRQRPQKGDQNIPHQPGYREKMIANIHVAGTYYFGIILVTRQFLIQHVTPQLRGRDHHHHHHHANSRANTKKGSHASSSSSSSSSVAELSRACIGAATYLAQMCREAADADVFRGNMCIVKAWVFAAGLVLGFALLADENEDHSGYTSPDAREAFRGSQHVLCVLGRLSAQARQYHGILVAFADAIDKYRRQRRREQRGGDESRVPLVEQILSYDDDVSQSGVSAEQAGDDGGVSSSSFHYGGDELSSSSSSSSSMVVVDTGQALAQSYHPQGVVVDGAGTSSQFQGHAPGFGVVDGSLAVGDPGFWNGSDDLSSTSDFLPDHWPSPADNELMLRILWDGYTMSFDEPVPTMPC